MTPLRNIMAKRHIHKLEEFTHSNMLLAFDFDGTLAPIVRDPDRARMRPRTRRLLGEVAERYPCAVISGRAREDTLARLGKLPVRGVIGNHGIEPSAELDRCAALVRRWRPLLERSLAGLAGVVIEDKRYSLAIHFRNAREKRRAHDAIAAAVAGLDGARVIGGKQVVNVLADGAPHK